YNTCYKFGATTRAISISNSHQTSGSSRGIDVSSSNYFSSTGSNYGTRSAAQGTNTTYGGYFSAYNSSGGTSYGIYASGGSGSSQYAGYFNGKIAASSYTYTSDRNLKKAIRPSDEVLDQVLKVKVYNYEYKTKEYQHMALPQGAQTGFIAQDIEKVFPQLVHEAVHPASDPELVEEGILAAGEEVTYKGVDYMAMVPYLTKAIQEMHEMYSTKIVALEAEIAALKQSENATEPQEIKSQLFQNIPNPASDHTMLPFFLEEDVRRD
ncbi:MAG: tail fiber domain-containing protein, partial [Bacteroidota bacterium]